MVSNPSLTAAPADAALIVASLSQPELFATVFDRHFAAIYGYLARRAGREPADELSSQTFTVAFEARGRFDPRADSARPWLYGIATNLLRDDLRDRRRASALLQRAALSQHASPDPTDLPTAFGFAADSEPLALALAQLDDDQRDALLLLAWGELSYAEIADALGVPIGTVRSRIARAREHLRTQLAAGASDPAPSMTKIEETT